MSRPEHGEPPTDSQSSWRERQVTRWAEYSRRAEAASETHTSVAVPFRAARSNTRVAASALSGGFAYRLFFWLLPFSLFVGGALDLGNADSSQDALASWGLPGLAVDTMGDAAREAGTSRLWIAAICIPALLWTGYTGTKSAVLIHGLIWNDPPDKLRGWLRASLGFSGICLMFMAVLGTIDWLRDNYWSVGLLTAVLTIAPLAGIWLLISLRLPHSAVDWRMLVPGALLFGIGLELLHLVTAYVVLPALQHSSEVYGAAGITSTYLFYMYLVGRLVVTAPILNSALREELEERDDHSSKSMRDSTHTTDHEGGHRVAI